MGDLVHPPSWDELSAKQFADDALTRPLRTGVLTRIEYLGAGPSYAITIEATREPSPTLKGFAIRGLHADLGNILYGANIPIVAYFSDFSVDSLMRPGVPLPFTQPRPKQGSTLYHADLIFSLSADPEQPGTIVSATTAHRQNLLSLPSVAPVNKRHLSSPNITILERASVIEGQGAFDYDGVSVEERVQVFEDAARGYRFSLQTRVVGPGELPEKAFIGLESRLESLRHRFNKPASSEVTITEVPR